MSTTSETQKRPVHVSEPLQSASFPKYNLLRLADVIAKTTLSRSTIYNMVLQGKFPAYIKIGQRSSVWLEHEVDAWIQQQIELGREGGLQ